MKRSLRTLTWLLVFPLLLALAACESESEPEPEPAMETPDTTAAAAPGAMQAGSSEKINLNTASGDAFRTIPGVGDRMVREFEEYRPYVSIQQFRREMGKYVDEDQVAAYERYVFVPIDPNESDAATLQQIPGLDASEADEVIGGRPYDSSDAFLEALSAYVDEGALETAERYLASP